jgi:heme exporter protein D
MQRFRSLFVWLLAGLSILSLLTACHRSTPAEKTFLQFQEAIERGRRKEAWSLLAKSTQAHFQQLAQQSNSSKKSTAQQLFVKGELHWKQHLRPHPTIRPQARGNSSVLTLRDEMDLLWKIRMLRENNQWKVDLLSKVKPPSSPRHRPAIRKTTGAGTP